MQANGRKDQYLQFAEIRYVHAKGKMVPAQRNEDGLEKFPYQRPVMRSFVISHAHTAMQYLMRALELIQMTDDPKVRLALESLRQLSPRSTVQANKQRSRMSKSSNSLFAPARPSISTLAVLASILAILIGIPARAADVPSPVQPVAPVAYAASFSWTGFYVERGAQHALATR